MNPRFERVQIVSAPSVVKADFGESVVSDEKTIWDSYSQVLFESGFSTVSINELDASCSSILRNGILGSTGSEVSTNYRSGLVVGAVQSGKTAAMMALIAKSVDAGVDLILVLGGTRRALWEQTFERVINQLDFGKKAKLFPPKESWVGGVGFPYSIQDTYSLTTKQEQRRLAKKGRTSVFVSLKQIDHLQALSRHLKDNVFPAYLELNKPFKMIVLDDEADDSSIDNLENDYQIGPDAVGLRQVPKSIVDLWSSRKFAPTPLAENLSLTYISFTATPQANLLQSSANHLKPTDFVFALKHPGVMVNALQRKDAFEEPGGLKKSYTGGFYFYSTSESKERFFVDVDSESFLQEEKKREHDTDCRCVALENSLIAFFVASAIRTYRSPKRSLSKLKTVEGLSLEVMASKLPAPCSMLVHPSSGVEDHFEQALEILEWLGSDKSIEDFEDYRRSDAGQFTHSLVNKLDLEVEKWEYWLKRYKNNSNWLCNELKLEEFYFGNFPSFLELRDVLEKEIFPNVTVDVVNSDDRSSDRPNFNPTQTNDVVRLPNNIYSIFVAGNVMSRGLTIEGLVTSFFSRKTANPAADTQSQMQRWFGYRGSHLDLETVFMSSEQFKLFEKYHEADEFMRNQIIIKGEDSANGGFINPALLENDAYRVTQKVGYRSFRVRNPGARFVTLVNSESIFDSNLNILSDLFETQSAAEVGRPGKDFGYILKEPLSALEIAEILDRLHYENLNLIENDLDLVGWEKLEEMLDLERGSLFKEIPNGAFSQSGFLSRSYPYSISAYLRFWKSASNIDLQGFISEEKDSRKKWRQSELSNYSRKMPEFYVGLRHGSGESKSLRVLTGGMSSSELKVKPRKTPLSNFIMTSGWGGRNPTDNFFGDQLFDFHLHSPHSRLSQIVNESNYRSPGRPGLLLFTVVQESEDEAPRLALGVNIPFGGPQGSLALEVNN